MLPFAPHVTVNAGLMFWLKALLAGRFSSPPGVRLSGKAGPLREATAQEVKDREHRVRRTKWLKGSRLLWTNFTHVREVTFTSFRPVIYPVMMEHLWIARRG